LAAQPERGGELGREVADRQARAGAQRGQHRRPGAGVAVERVDDGSVDALGADLGARRVVVGRGRRDRQPRRDLVGELVARVLGHAGDELGGIRPPARAPRVDELAQGPIGVKHHGPRID
jgi:hypothetical protein